MNPTPHEDDMAFAVIEHFCSRLFLVFSCFFFTVEFKKDRNLLNELGMSRRSLWILPTIHDACLNTTLMAIRDIDDFLTPRMGGSRKDDLKASDLGFKEDFGFLGKTERERINKLIMHSTKVAAYGNQESSWDIGELTSKCVSQSLYFLRWVQANCKSAKHQKAWAAAVFYTTQTEAILEYAKKVKASNIGSSKP